MLAAPATAVAQSAGDEQYQDPFGGSQSQEPDDQGTSSPSATPSPSAGATGDATATPTAAPVAATSQSAPAAQQLPRTGDDAGLLALGGAVLLAGGVALRRRLS